MIQINEYEDIERFVDQIVAYTTTSETLGRDNGYPINEDKNIKYGYITKEKEYDKEKWYEIYQLISPENLVWTKWITKDKLSSNLFIRNISREELFKIKESIKEGKATFEYIYNIDVYVESSVKLLYFIYQYHK